MPRVKLSEDWFVEGKLHVAGKIHEFPDWLAKVIVSRNCGEYVDDTLTKKAAESEPVTKTDTSAKVTVKTLGRKKTVTEP